jgi:hypothetical protein
MTCQEFGLIARDYARSEWLSAAEHERATAHVAQCPTCRERVASEIALTAALGRVRQRQEHVGAPQNVQAALMAAFSSQHPKPRPFSKHLYWAVPAAAALLFGIAMTRPRPVDPPRRASVPPLVETVVRTQPAQEVEPDPQPPLVTPAPRRTRPMRLAAATPSARVTEFIPLRFGKPVESGEQIQVVRLQMRRSELMRLGLPVAPDAASAFIQADVLLGEDGMAKAIRFVY